MVDEKLDIIDDDEGPEETELVDVSEVSHAINLEDKPRLLKETPIESEPRHYRGFTSAASLRERFAAFFIDSTILFYLYFALGTIARRAFYGSWDGPIPSYGWQGLTFNGGFIFITFLYYFILEGAFFTTPGKFCCWMHVRRKDFGYTSMSSIFVRNVFRLLDYALPFLPIFLMELTRTHQRLGDIIAGTTVTKKSGEVSMYYNVNMDNIASSTGRIISSLLDIIIVGSLTFGYILLLSPDYPTISRWLLLFAPIVPLVYFITSEPLTHTSPGKWIIGYTVTHEDGTPVSFSASLIRTLFRAFDMNPIGLVATWLSVRRQRPGDLAANTLVSRQKRLWYGSVALVAWILISGGVLWIGLQNTSSIISGNFKFNFAPTLEIMGGTAESVAYKTPTLTHFRFSVGDVNTIRTPAVFQPGETMFVTFDLYGYERSGRLVWIQEDLDVKYPDGSIGLHQENIVDYHQVVSGNGPIELTNNMALPSTAVPGTYTLTLTVRDLFAHERVTAQQSFEVKSPTPPATP